MSQVTVFHAKKIITMNPTQPVATHVAVRDGRILAVGSMADMQGLGSSRVDESFKDKVLMPGLVEGHCHTFGGALWDLPYVGFYDRRGPDGALWKGLKSLDEVVTRLSAHEQTMTDPEEPLLAWGFDPIYFDDARMSVRELDRVSATRPIMVLHISFHLMTVNSAMLKLAGITEDTPIEGVVKFPDGSLTGELREMAAMFPVNRVVSTGLGVSVRDISRKSLYNFAHVAQQAGVTTATDLANRSIEAQLPTLAAVTAEQAFPLRLVPVRLSSGDPANVANEVELIAASKTFNTGKLRLGSVKLITDGSIQGFTGRLRWPGYFNGSPNGIWVTPPERILQLVERYHAAGVHLHIHTNGDEATEVTLDALQSALEKHPRWEHRHTLQHAQMADASLFRRMKNLDVCVNLFTNHIFYWGDTHYEQTMGPSRAAHMDACRSAQLSGTHFAIHSDAPVTPIGPLFTAWCAVNRKTASGRTLGAGESISVMSALEAITLGAAYTLNMDGEIGSIEVRKCADFCVLEEDPLAVDPDSLKDVGIWGTVLGGHLFKSPAAQEASAVNEAALEV